MCGIYTESKQRIAERLNEIKADLFYKTKIVQKHNQILFGHWLLITIQQKDIKQRIVCMHKQNVLKRHWHEWVVQYEENKMIHQFQAKWNAIKSHDLYLKIFIVWKKQCKYQISLISKKKEFELNKQCKIMSAWYLTVYKRRKLNQCQLIAKQYAIQSAFIRWKVTMKHHLTRK